jgi:hypothetical protein
VSQIPLHLWCLDGPSPTARAGGLLLAALTPSGRAASLPSAPQDLAAVLSPSALDLDWTAFLDLVARHRVTSLVAARLPSLADLGAPEGVVARFEERRRRAAMANLRMIAEARSVGRLLETGGLRALHLKGPALSVVAFGEATLRDGRDVDLLVAPEDVAHADRLLLAAGHRRIKPDDRYGPLSRFYARYAHERVYVSPGGVAIEVKSRLHGLTGLWSPSAADLFAEAVTVDVAGEGLATIGPAHLLPYLALHGAHHGWFRLKWLADVAALLALSGGRVDALPEGARTAILEAVLHSHRRLGAPLDDGILRQAEADPGVAARRDLVADLIATPTDRATGALTPERDAALLAAERHLSPRVGYRLATRERHFAGRVAGWLKRLRRG